MTLFASKPSISLSSVLIGRIAFFGLVLLSMADALADDRQLSVNVEGLLDFRMATFDSERTWLDGDFGKARYGDGSWHSTLRLSDAALLVRPSLGWDIDGYIYLQSGPDQDHSVDLVEGFLRYRPVSTSRWRVRARAGLFYPPVSLENTGVAWTSAYTITPSAINAWIGEETRGYGGEMTLLRAGDDANVGVSVALTGGNDKAGTLLYRRGWALHDFRPGVRDSLPLPVPYNAPGLPDSTKVGKELDGDPGYYLSLAWKQHGGHRLRLMYYDNRADPRAQQGDQHAWETHFTAAGAQFRLPADTEFLTQYIRGNTLLKNNATRLDMDYQAVYGLVSRAFGRQRLSARFDWYETDDIDSVPADFGEDGWAITGAWIWQVDKHQKLLFEAMTINSDRPSRSTPDQGESADDIVIQLGYRLVFGW